MKAKDINPYDCIQVSRIRKRHRTKRILRKKETQRERRNLGFWEKKDDA